NEADYLRRQSEAPRRLLGIHALLDIDEVSIVAVPEAVQPGWQQRATTTPPPPIIMPRPKPAFAAFKNCAIRNVQPPKLQAKTDWEHPRNVLLDWTPQDGNRFIVEESKRADFAHSTEVFNGRELKATLYGRASGTYYYRAAATDGINRS